MSVVVAAATRDHRDRRPQLSQLALETVVGRAVVRNLEDLDVPREQPRCHIRLCVGGQERVDLAVRGEQDDRQQVGVLALRARAIRPQHPQMQPAEPERVSRPRLDDLDAVLLGLGQRRALVAARPCQARVEHPVDSESAQHGLGPTDVVALRMGENNRSQPPDAECA